jgi:hypothetical protein
MPNPSESHPATIADVGYGRTVIELPDATWNALALGVGDRVIVQAGDDVCAGEVTDQRVVTLALSIGGNGDRVRVRRPNMARVS